MKRVIVTGGTGFVGANLARRLLQDGHAVYLLVRPGHKAWRIQSIRDHAQIYQVDFGDPVALTQVVSRIRPDWVFHLGAYGAYSWQTDSYQMVQTNIVGTISLVHACLKTGFAAFVNTGSSSEYGLKDHAPGETELLEPNSEYAVTKACATLYCSQTARSQGVHLPTLRLYSVYGPYEEPGRLIPTLIVRGLEGKLPPLVRPDIARDYVYIDDVYDAYVLAASESQQERGAIYNVGTGVQTSLREVVDVARRVLDIAGEPEWATMSARSWDTDIWIANSAKIEETLSWRPRFTFEQGFLETVAWFRGNADLQGVYSDPLPAPVADSGKWPGKPL